MEKISYRKEVEISNEYERELFNSECHDDGECSKSGTLSKLANIAAFANKFASDDLKNQVDEVANRVFGIYDIED